MELKRDCFAYNPLTKECLCLNELYCAKENCHFYKNCKDINTRYIENDIRSYSRGK